MKQYIKKLIKEKYWVDIHCRDREDEWFMEVRIFEYDEIGIVIGESISSYNDDFKYYVIPWNSIIEIEIGKISENDEEDD